MSSFQDLFSNHAACYAQARPGYPPELFAYLAGLVPQRKLAWDVGTGNGQAAVGLAAHFERVIATDASAAQIAHAAPHERIEYRVATAEEVDLPPASVDLVTVAQALHWLKLDAFYANVRRVLRPHGLIAAWCYTLPEVSEAVDAVMMRLYRDITGPYWPDDRRLVESRYETIAFPFEEIRPVPSFACRLDWTLGDYANYLTSWSGSQGYKRRHGTDPLDLVRQDFESAWGGGQRRIVSWLIHLRVGRVAGDQRQSLCTAMMAEKNIWAHWEVTKNWRFLSAPRIVSSPVRRACS
jgi:SAM-dependent methyltransferase